MLCETCRIELTREQAFDVGEKNYCSTCFFKVAEAFRREMTPEERRLLKEMVKDEMEGVLPRGPLKEIIADGFKRVASRKVDLEEELGHIVNQIERICGMVMFREVLSVIEAIKTTLDVQEDEIRNKLRKLQKL